MMEPDNIPQKLKFRFEIQYKTQLSINIRFFTRNILRYTEINSVVALRKKINTK